MIRRSFVGRMGVLLACSLSAVSLSFAEPTELVVEHAQGSTTISAPPSRVAVFDPGSLDTLLALGVDVAGVPKGSWPDHLKQYAESDHVEIGTLFEPDYDALKSLKPDLIIIAGRSSRKHEALSEIAPTIDLSVDATQFVDGVRSNLRLLGQIFNRADKAAQLDAELVTALEALRTTGAQAGSALMLFTVSDNVMVHGPGERFGMIYELTGMPSTAAPAVAEASGPRPEPGSPEAIARRKQMQERLAKSLAPDEPSWLFVLDRGAAVGDKKGTAATTLGEDAGIAASQAWRSHRVYYLDAPTWYVVTSGYLGLLHSARDIQQALAASR